MKSIRYNYIGLLLLWLMPWLSSCNPTLSIDVLDDDDDELVEHEIDFGEISMTDDAREIKVKARVEGGVGLYNLADEVQVSNKVTELYSFSKKVGDQFSIKLDKITNLSDEFMRSNNIKVFVLSDLTMSPFAIDKQRQALLMMRNQFGGNLYVSFLTPEGVTETMMASDYVINHYCVSLGYEDDSPYVYRAIATKLEEVCDTTSILYDSDLFAFFVFTDGNTWLGDMPVDISHFSIKREITNIITNVRLEGQPVCDFMSVVYFDEDPTSIEKDSFLDLLASQTGGVSLYTFDWGAILNAMWKKFNLDFYNYEFTFVNPYFKALRGWGYQVDVDFFSKDVEISHGSFIYNAGTSYNPLIVGGIEPVYIFLQGLLLMLLIVGLAYLIMQLLIPYVRYRIFRYRHMPLYTGKEMTWLGRQVGEICYFCKDNLKIGDRIVSCCPHTMHESCWEENEYHCTEYGHGCKEGSHYYDRHHLFSKRNAIIYQPWILVSILGAFIVWTLSIMTPLLPSLSHSFFTEWVEGLAGDTLHETPATTILFESMFYTMPPTALVFTFVMTVLISSLTVRKSTWFVTVSYIIWRSLLSACIGYVLVILFCLIDGLIQDLTVSMIIYVLMWMLIWVTIMFSVIWHTRIRPRLNWIYASGIVFMLGTLIWRYVYLASIDNRLTLMMALILMGIGIGIGLATSLPRSERFVLHVSGAIKEMDIALFKWFKANPHETVTIGKSIFTTLHMTWDLTPNLAPIEADIHYERGVLKLFPHEPSVFHANGKPYKAGRGYALNHGQKFVIGKTTFTFIELDR